MALTAHPSYQIALKMLYGKGDLGNQLQLLGMCQPDNAQDYWRTVVQAEVEKSVSVQTDQRY